MYKLGTAANYAGERDLVVGGVPGNTLIGYNALEGDLTQAIGSDESVFKSAAADGVNALDPLAGRRDRRFRADGARAARGPSAAGWPNTAKLPC